MIDTVTLNPNIAESSPTTWRYWNLIVLSMLAFSSLLISQLTGGWVLGRMKKNEKISCD